MEHGTDYRPVDLDTEIVPAWILNKAAKVLSNRIYLLADGKTDPSRWLEVSFNGKANAVLVLSELCNPGEGSSLKCVNCPVSALREAVDIGATVQITLADGYLLISAHDALFELDFRGREDHAPTRCSVARGEVSHALSNHAIEPVQPVFVTCP